MSPQYYEKDGRGPGVKFEKSGFSFSQNVWESVTFPILSEGMGGLPGLIYPGLMVLLGTLICPLNTVKRMEGAQEPILQKGVPIPT